MEINSLELNRFWSKVDIRSETECWNWVAGKYEDGYGCFSLRRKSKRAHVISWVLQNGEVLEGLSVLHKCNNPSCCNPNHLYLGTHFQNMQDRKTAGRYEQKGEKNVMAKLSLRKAKTLKAFYEKGMFSIIELADIYELGYHGAYKVAKGLRWNHGGKLA